MAQTYVDNCYAGGDVYSIDMQAMEDNFAALKSSFSGGGAPGVAFRVAGIDWFDSTKKSLKFRNSADSAWLGVFAVDSLYKTWVYRNAACEGWAIDATITDRVLAVKGGAVYITGGTLAGTWQQLDHVLIEAEFPAHTHGSGGAHTHAILYNTTSQIGGSGSWGDPYSGSGFGTSTEVEGPHTHTSSGSGEAHNHGLTHRPAAAIGTLQYVDG